MACFRYVSCKFVFQEIDESGAVFEAVRPLTTLKIATWIACACVCLFNSAMPHLNTIGIFLILAGFLITIIVV